MGWLYYLPFYSRALWTHDLVLAWKAIQHWTTLSSWHPIFEHYVSLFLSYLSVSLYYNRSGSSYPSANSHHIFFLWIIFYRFYTEGAECFLVYKWYPRANVFHRGNKVLVCGMAPWETWKVLVGYKNWQLISEWMLENSNELHVFPLFEKEAEWVMLFTHFKCES